MGWSEEQPDGAAYKTVGPEALRELYDTDAHFVPYYLEGSPACPRLLKEVADDPSYPIRFEVVPLDCEPVGHPDVVPEAWRENFRAVADELGWAYYETRGGGRMLFATMEPVTIAQFLVIQRRAMHLLESKGVDVDPTTNQWGRCYRLPFVMRNGVPQRHRAGRMDAIPRVDLGELPSALGLGLEGMFDGVAGARLPLEDRGNVGCNPPLPSREVAAIARSAQRWEAGGRSEPEEINDDRPLHLGDHVEVARRLLAELPNDTVGDRGALWTYMAGLGCWESSDGDELARRAARFSGFPIRGRNDRDGNPTFTSLKVRDSDCKGVAGVMLREHRTPGFFDQERPGVCFANGFVGEHGVLEPHSPHHRATTSVPFDYEPGVQPEAFIRFLSQIWEPLSDTEEMIQLCREIIGVYATGLATRFQQAFILLGGGANGKSVLLDVVRSLFERDAVTAISPQEWGEEYRRARLAKARVNLVSELPEVEMMSSEKVKGIISGDVTEARAIYGAPFDFTPRAGHLFSANALPGVRDHSHGFWRRWSVLPFPRTFAPEEQDRTLTQRLVETQRGLIMSWAVEAVPGVLARGGYVSPLSCQRVTRDWRARADQVACFMDECEVVSKPGWSIQASQLYNRYVEWAKLNGYRNQLSGRVFGERVKTIPGVGTKKTRAGREYFDDTRDGLHRVGDG
jgi:P4 family phage/plasmid primase-like protien